MGVNYFILETRGHCLYCLKRDGPQNEGQPTFSLQRLLKYLKIKLTTLTGDDTPPESLEVLRDCEMKGVLCAKCEQLLDKTLDVLEELEVLQMKLGYYLKLTKEEVEESGDGGDLEQFRKEMGMEDCGVVERLRRELVNKCSSRVERSPQIILERLEFKEDLEPEFKCDPIQDKPVKMEIGDEWFEEDPLLPEEESVHQSGMHDDIDFSSSAIYQEILNRGRQEQGQGSRFRCQICHKSYSSMYNLRDHQKSVHEGIKYKCPLCPFTSNFGSCMSKHKRLSHDGLLVGTEYEKIQIRESDNDSRDKKFKCDLCERTFCKASSVYLHKKTVHFGVRYTCDYCGKLFTQKGQMKLHMKRRCKMLPRVAD